MAGEGNWLWIVSSGGVQCNGLELPVPLPELITRLLFLN
jgi:hypothetical protein